MLLCVFREDLYEAKDVSRWKESCRRIGLEAAFITAFEVFMEKAARASLKPSHGGGSVAQLRGFWTLWVRFRGRDPDRVLSSDSGEGYRAACKV